MIDKRHSCKIQLSILFYRCMDNLKLKKQDATANSYTSEVTNFCVPTKYYILFGRSVHPQASVNFVQSI